MVCFKKLIKITSALDEISLLPKTLSALVDPTDKSRADFEPKVMQYSMNLTYRNLGECMLVKVTTYMTIVLSDFTQGQILKNNQ